MLTLQLIGEIVVRALGLPLPGPVIGMLLLFIGLGLRGSTPTPLNQLATGLLQHLSLLFVPAGVGVMSYLAIIEANWAALGITIIASTMLAIVVTALTLRLLTRRKAEQHD
nr:CidA/LrgA family protein [Spiribacter salilacus]